MGAHLCSCFYSVSNIIQKNLFFPVDIKYSEDVVFRYMFLCQCRKQYYFNKALFLYRANEYSVLHSIKNWDSVMFDNVIPAWEWARK